MNTVELPHQVGGNCFYPGNRVVLFNRTESTGDGGVVDENVEPAQRIRHSTEKRANRSNVRNISDCCGELNALFMQCRNAVLVNVANMHPCTLGSLRCLSSIFPLKLKLSHGRVGSG